MPLTDNPSDNTSARWVPIPYAYPPTPRQVYFQGWKTGYVEGLVTGITLVVFLYIACRFLA
jgi:hypothetical protein